MKKIAFLFLAFNHFYCVAQQNSDSLLDINLLYIPPKETFFVSGINFNRFTALDYMVSPLVNDGFGFGANLGVLKRKNNALANLSFSLSSANLKNQMQAKHYITELNHVSINCGKNYEINSLSFNKIVTSIGWQFNQVFDFKSNSQFQNSSLTYHISSAISPVIRFEKWISFKESKKRLAFKKQRSMRINYQFSLPLIAGVSRPNYNAIQLLKDGTGGYYQNSIASEIITNYKLYAFKNYVAINSILCVEYYLKNGNRLMLQYFWNFEQMKKENYAFKMAQTGVQLCFFTRLNSL